MADVIQFFARETLVGPVSDPASYVSAPHDVTAFSSLTVELCVFSSSDSAAIVSGYIEETMAPQLEPWSVLGAVTVSGLTSSGIDVDNMVNPLRFVRGRIEVPPGTEVVLSLSATKRTD